MFISYQIGMFGCILFHRNIHGLVGTFNKNRTDSNPMAIGDNSKFEEQQHDESELIEYMQEGQHRLDAE